MLTPEQQQEMINVAKMIDPMYLWSGSLDEFTPTPTPATYSFILEKLNNQNIVERTLKLTTMPLYLPNDPYIVNILDHCYVNIMYEKQLFYNGSGVTIESSNPHMRPEIQIKWTFLSLLTNLIILGREFIWLVIYILTNKHVAIGTYIEKQVTEAANHCLTSDKLDEIEADIDTIITCVLATEIIDDLLEQYVKEDVKPKYLYSWDIIEAYYWQRHRPLDLYYQSTYQIGAVNAGIITRDQYLGLFGTRGIVDFELMSPRYSEVPDSIFGVAAESEKKIWAEKLVNISAVHELRPMDKKLLNAAWEIKALRGTVRMKSLCVVAKLRAYLLQISKENSIPDDLIFFMVKEEINKGPKLFIEQAGKRKEMYLKNMQVTLPTLLTRDVVVKMTAIHEKGEKTIGSAVSAGEAAGKLIYVNSPETDAKEIENMIVVFPDASPEFSMLYRHAKGIIFESGGAMSHGAIVAREYRIPAISLGGHELNWEAKTDVAVNGTEGTAVIL